MRPDPMRPVERCEVAVVGGGFAGLAAAYRLAREGRDVVLLEAGRLGDGASGKNTGMLGPGVQAPIAALVKKHGRAEARRMFQATVSAVESVLALVREERIACDLEVNGQLLLARTERVATALREQALLHAELGFDVRSLDADGVRARIGSPLYAGGLVFPAAANLDPVLLGRGLARAARERGARIIEGARVLCVRPGKPARIAVGSFDLIKSNHLDPREAGWFDSIKSNHLDAAGPARTREAAPAPEAARTLEADQVVLATNAFTPELGFLRGRVVRLTTHVIATEPLDARQVAALGWPGREGAVEARRVFHYFRLDAANPPPLGGGATTREDPREWRRLERELARIFPSLDGVRIERRWSGPMGFTLDLLPIVGELDEAPGVLHAGAWCGHGVALSIASGERIAELVLARTGARTPGPRTGPLPWYRGSAPWLPPDPLRAAGIEVYLSVLRAADRIAEGAAS